LVLGLVFGTVCCRGVFVCDSLAGDDGMVDGRRGRRRRRRRRRRRGGDIGEEEEEEIKKLVKK